MIKQILKQHSTDNTPRLTQFFIGEQEATLVALGSVMRASGYGLKSTLVGFLGKTRSYKEAELLCTLPEVECRVIEKEPKADLDGSNTRDAGGAKKALFIALETLLSGECDILVCDGITTALKLKMLQIEDIRKLIKNKPENVELILTGVEVPQEIISLVDLVTCVDHKETLGR
jgi:cob(I)alamin adenosyltransferase